MAAVIDQGRIYVLSQSELDEHDERLIEKTIARVQAASNTTAGASATKALAKRQQTASALAISLATLDRLTKTNVLPSVRVGGHRRYDLDECRAALANRKSSTGE